MSLTETILGVDRRVKGILRRVDEQTLTKVEQRYVRSLKLACNEVKKDIRDYEYAEDRAGQLKWAKIARHNLRAVETCILGLGSVFGAADTAELFASIESVHDNLN